MRNIKSLLDSCKGGEKYFCEGSFLNSKKGAYIFGSSLSVAKTPIKFSHKGSIMLDEINAFDLAEIETANLGQTNMITVSSFCGPKGLIWGYDICRKEKKQNSFGLACVSYNGKRADVYDALPLFEAFQNLTGSVKDPHFPFLPGTHLPCAMRSFTVQGKKTIYAAVGIGIPVNRKMHACAVMEDVGVMMSSDKIGAEKEISQKIAESIMQIGENQGVVYKEIFIGVRDVEIEKNEIGCALVAAPYFVLPSNALPNGKDMTKLTISQWEKLVSKNYLSSK